ncbi:hypothetical protein CLOP_g759 [Closterium sp. NIES-67]|nr:hypothetical protein CLOP_g759 [Closterium sp. NIES-67]
MSLVLSETTGCGGGCSNSSSSSSTSSMSSNNHSLNKGGSHSSCSSSSSDSDIVFESGFQYPRALTYHTGNHPGNHTGIHCATVNHSLLPSPASSLPNSPAPKLSPAAAPAPAAAAAAAPALSLPLSSALSPAPASLGSEALYPPASPHSPRRQFDPFAAPLTCPATPRKPTLPPGGSASEHLRVAEEGAPARRVMRRLLFH